VRKPFSDRHPNSPLVEVVFEIRFPGETAVECLRHVIQERIRGDFPSLFVPNAQQGMATALQPYRFEKADGSAGVMAALNSFSYFARNYDGFELFRKEALRLMKLLVKTVPVREITRVGLRHVNIIPFVRKGESIPVESVFFFGEKVAELLSRPFENFSAAFTVPIGAGKMTARIEALSRKDGGQEAFLLDLDYFRTEGLRISALGQYLEEAHEESNLLFLKIISQSYHDYIEGLEP
jgi:uncharacterized protein (TIGR04255 family)